MNDPHEQNDTGIGVQSDPLSEVFTRLQTFKLQRSDLLDTLGQIDCMCEDVEAGDFPADAAIKEIAKVVRQALKLAIAPTSPKGE